MQKGILYKQCDSLAVMESLPDNEYRMIYLDVPYYTGTDTFALNDGSNSIRVHLAKQRECSLGDITIEQIASEKEDKRREKVKEYAGMITHVIENAYRLLKDDGILCFLSPSKEYVDINYRLILDQFFKSYTSITIERPMRNSAISHSQHGNNDTLYFYSIQENFVFPQLKEADESGRYNCEDERGSYFKRYMISPQNRPSNQYDWHGIKNPINKSWCCPKSKMDELYEDNRIVIENEKVYQKQYKDEYPITVSSVWKNEDRFSRISRISIGSSSFERMFKMTVPEGGKVLCPYDRDGKFSLLANECGLQWTSIYCPIDDRGWNVVNEIPEGEYVVEITCSDEIKREYRDGIVMNITDIRGLQENVDKLLDDMHRIQTTVGLDESDDIRIEEILDKIHEKTQNFVEGLDLTQSISQAKIWLDPCWLRLEADSKLFLPVGILFSEIASKYSNKNKMEMTPTVIEYCKTLEKELFSKIFVGYIRDIINRHMHVRSVFDSSFNNMDTKIFAKFVRNCSHFEKDKPQNWQLEIGKMITILKFTLEDKMNEPLINDFRKYLEKIFEYKFFEANFIENLKLINELRNDCAHTSFVNEERASEGKDIIREKLLVILKNYK